MRRYAPFVFLVFTVVGALVPLLVFAPWIFERGPDLDRFIRDVTENRAAAFVFSDYIISAVVLTFASLVYLQRIQALIVFIATISVGVSFGLPLFFLFQILRRRPLLRRADIKAQTTPASGRIDV
ncbi:MAG: DUF2834 domain-containing protein [Pseudomonadota bacterium]